MIVRERGTVIQLITQPDHAALAARVMAQCVDLASHPRRDLILKAVAEHDGGWADEDASPTINPATGQIFDFISAPLPVRHRVWPRGVSLLAGDPWSAALVAQHALTVYDRFHVEPEWSAFFARMEGMRDEMVASAALRVSDLETDYRFLRLGDLISLAFCTGSTGEQRIAGWSVRLVDSRVVVTPDVFGGRMIPMQITAREIPNRRYESDGALRSAVAAASTSMLEGQII